jgi:hypothetical protein
MGKDRGVRGVKNRDDAFVTPLTRRSESRQPNATPLRRTAGRRGPRPSPSAPAPIPHTRRRNEGKLPRFPSNSPSSQSREGRTAQIGTNAPPVAHLPPKIGRIRVGFDGNPRKTPKIACSRRKCAILGHFRRKSGRHGTAGAILGSLGPFRSHFAPLGGPQPPSHAIRPTIHGRPARPHPPSPPLLEMRRPHRPPTPHRRLLANVPALQPPNRRSLRPQTHGTSPPPATLRRLHRPPHP